MGGSGNSSTNSLVNEPAKCWQCIAMRNFLAPTAVSGHVQARIIQGKGKTHSCQASLSLGLLKLNAADSVYKFA